MIQEIVQETNKKSHIRCIIKCCHFKTRKKRVPCGITLVTNEDGSERNLPWQRYKSRWGPLTSSRVEWVCSSNMMLSGCHKDTFLSHKSVSATRIGFDMSRSSRHLVIKSDKGRRCWHVNWLGEKSTVWLEVGFLFLFFWRIVYVCHDSGSTQQQTESSAVSVSWNTPREAKVVDLIFYTDCQTRTYNCTHFKRWSWVDRYTCISLAAPSLCSSLLLLL